MHILALTNNFTLLLQLNCINCDPFSHGYVQCDLKVLYSFKTIRLKFYISLSNYQLAVSRGKKSEWIFCHVSECVV